MSQFFREKIFFGFLAFAGILGSSATFGAWGKEKTEVLAEHNPTAEEQGEDSTELFQPYMEYGLEYDEAAEVLYYQGKKVRQFSDLYPVNSGEAGVYYLKEAGEVDVYGVRDLSEIKYNKDGSFDPSGQLTGLRVAGKEEFGLIYNEKEDQFYYQGEPVRWLFDILESNGEELESGKFHGAMRTIWKDGGTVDVYTKRSENGTLTAVIAYSEEEFKTHRSVNTGVFWSGMSEEE